MPVYIWHFSPSRSELAEGMLSSISGILRSVALSSLCTTIFSLPFDRSISFFASIKDRFSVTVPLIYVEMRRYRELNSIFKEQQVWTTDVCLFNVHISKLWPIFYYPCIRQRSKGQMTHVRWCHTEQVQCAVVSHQCTLGQNLFHSLSTRPI